MPCHEILQCVWFQLKKCFEIPAWRYYMSVQFLSPFEGKCCLQISEFLLLISYSNAVGTSATK